MVALPSHADAKALLPVPHWAGHERELACWDLCWKLAFQNIMNPKPGTGFVSPFIDTAFNGCVFMWDSVIMLQFARYGRRAFDFQATLDNFYAKQHPDGFICREIDWSDGGDRYERHNPVSTGPNILAWCEADHYRHTGDAVRISQVLPALIGFHRWMRQYRTWPDGSYWSCGWSSGMDNAPRVGPGSNICFHHDWMAWVDTTGQQMLSCRKILELSNAAWWDQPTIDMAPEALALKEFLNSECWNEKLGSYTDRTRRGVSDVLTLAGWWAVLAGATDSRRFRRMRDLVADPEHFFRPHPLPFLSASHPAYSPHGAYARGGVWAPNVACVLAALRNGGDPALAHLLARRHVEAVARVAHDTGTIWENYAPDRIAAAHPSKKDFVGWSGWGPIAGLLEHVFGLDPHAPQGLLVWDCRLTEEHGVERYPFGEKGTLNLYCAARDSQESEPSIRVDSDVQVLVEVRWAGGTKTIVAGPAAY